MNEEKEHIHKKSPVSSDSSNGNQGLIINLKYSIYNI